jgi:hypothetical protein
VEVIEGVKAGDQVIVSDLGRLHDGAPIQVAPRPGT